MPNPYDGTQSCAQIDPDIFFPEKKTNKQIAKALKVCSSCALLSACREYSKSTPGLYGVWAGAWRDGSGYVTPLAINRLKKEVA